MQKQTGKFKKIINNNDKQRMIGLKQIDSEQQLKELKEKIKILKVEFLKKNQVAGEFQAYNYNLKGNIALLRIVSQEQIKNQEQEVQMSNEEIQWVIDLLKEMSDIVEDLQKNSENLKRFYEKYHEERTQWESENEQLKVEISRLDDFCFEMEPIKEENEKLKEELKNYIQEKMEFEIQMKQSIIKINNYLEEQKRVIKDQQIEKVKLQQYKESHQQMKYQLSELDRQMGTVKQENEYLKQQIKRGKEEKEENEIKMKTEMVRVLYLLLHYQVRQGLISVRKQEVDKQNELLKRLDHYLRCNLILFEYFQLEQFIFIKIEH